MNSFKWSKTRTLGNPNKFEYYWEPRRSWPLVKPTTTKDTVNCELHPKDEIGCKEFKLGSSSSGCGWCRHAGHNLNASPFCLLIYKEKYITKHEAYFKAFKTRIQRWLRCFLHLIFVLNLSLFLRGRWNSGV